MKPGTDAVADAAAAARARAASDLTVAETWSLDDPELARLRFDAELQLATLDQALGDLDAAERRLLDALELARKAAGADRCVVALTNALGVTYTLAGRLDDAQRRYDEVYDLLQAAPDTRPLDLAGLFHDLAGLAHARGDVANGIPWAQRAIAIRTQLGDEDSLHLARDLGGLGALQHLGRQLDEARVSYARALLLLDAALDPDHPEVAFVRTTLELVRRRARRIKDTTMRPPTSEIRRPCTGVRAAQPSTT